jgi:hypothetical protein|eukprot:SAG25_NODE_1078_length_4097_cov_12.124562_1_plen_103_part_00
MGKSTSVDDTAQLETGGATFDTEEARARKSQVRTDHGFQLPRAVTVCRLGSNSVDLSPGKSVLNKMHIARRERKALAPSAQKKSAPTFRILTKQLAITFASS